MLSVMDLKTWMHTRITHQIEVFVEINQANIPQSLIQLEVLSSMRHPNIIHLLGACPEYGCLVYEYMSKGSLEERLACQSGTPPLPWQLRFKIASEIATGLLFLHQQLPEPLVHRDLKPANILLDHNLMAKISDVGLARLIPSLPGGSNSTFYRMTAAAGNPNITKQKVYV